MNTRHAVLLAGVLALSSGCSNFLDVNTNPNGPQSVTAYLYLPPMVHWMVTAPQLDGRFVGRYTQQWTLPGNRNAKCQCFELQPGPREYFDVRMDSADRTSGSPNRSHGGCNHGFCQQHGCHTVASSS